VKRILPALFLLLLLAAASIATILLGGERAYSPVEFFRILAQGSGAEDGGDWIILMELRAPRAACAALVGCALALSGVLMQGLFRNPLASPGILGATSGGTFAAVVAIAVGLGDRSIVYVPLFAFTGSVFAILVVYLLAGHRHRFSSTHLILGGVAVNTLFSAGASLVLTLSVARHDVTRQIVGWLTGGVQLRGWEHVALVVPALAVALLGSFFVARDLNLMLVGEDSAQSLGVRLESLKRRTILLAGLATGAAVSVAGMVGFVGLVAPHIVRFVLGPDHRGLVVTATLFGGIFLVLADLVAVRVLYPQEIQLGIVTSLIGGPFFLYLIVREQRRTGGGA
jgi:iron complex transport system permease protein